MPSFQYQGQKKRWSLPPTPFIKFALHHKKCEAQWSKGERNNVAPVEILSLADFYITHVNCVFSKPFYACHHFTKHLKRGLKNSQWLGAVSEHYRRARGEQRAHCQFDYNITPFQRVNVVSQMSDRSLSLDLFSSFPRLSPSFLCLSLYRSVLLILSFLPALWPYLRGFDKKNPFKVECDGLKCHSQIRCCWNEARHIIRCAWLH